MIGVSFDQLKIYQVYGKRPCIKFTTCLPPWVNNVLGFWSYLAKCLTRIMPYFNKVLQIKWPIESIPSLQSTQIINCEFYSFLLKQFRYFSLYSFLQFRYFFYFWQFFLNYFQKLKKYKNLSAPEYIKIIVIL